MRKLQLQNYKVGSNSRWSILKVVNSCILRKRSSYRHTADDFLNDVCHNLFAKDGRWIGASTNDQSVVIINDERKEVGQVGKRCLITTGLIYDELLQTNRGNQNYEYERNKFYTQDATGNANDIRNDNYLHLLDILWHMNEEGFDAVEIENEGTDVDTKFLSCRYGDAVNNILHTAQQEVIPRLTELGNDYIKFIAKQDGGTVKWSKDIYRDDDEFFDNAELNRYDTEWDTIRTYLKYRKELCYRADEDDYKGVPTEFNTWEEHIAEFSKTKGRMHRDISTEFVASAFNFAQQKRSAIDIAFLDSRSCFEYNTIAPSKFKRNQDWTCDNLNFYKSEVLKLRKQMIEGSYNE